MCIKRWPNLFHIVFLFIILNCVPAYATPNLILEYEISIDDPSSHIIKVRTKITNNQTEEIELSRAGIMGATPAPLSGFQVVDGYERPIPYQLKSDDTLNELLIIPGSYQSILISYKADLLNTDTNGGTSYYLSEAYGAIEWLSFIYTPTHRSEDLIHNYGDNRNRYFFDFNLPEGWQEFCAFEKEDGRYKFDLPTPAMTGSEPMGPLAFYPNYTEYVRDIQGVETKFVFSEGYVPDAMDRLADDLFDYYEWANKNIGSIAANNRFPTKNYLICFLPKIEGIYPNNINHNTLGFIRGDFFPELSHSAWSKAFPNILPKIAGLITEGFIAANDAAIMYADGLHEGLNDYIVYNGLEELGKWTKAEKHAFLISNDYEPYLSIAGTENDKPVWDPNHELNPVPGSSDYIISYHKTTLVWFLLDQIIREKSGGACDIQKIFKYLFNYFALPKGGAYLVSGQVLTTINAMTSHNFTEMFNRYVYGNDVLPLYAENGILKVDRSLLPEIHKFSPPYAPSKLTLSVDQGVDTLTWKPVSEASGYNLYRSLGGYFWGDDFKFKKVNEQRITKTSFKINRSQEGLPLDAHIFYILTAVGENGAESLYSNMASDWEYIASLTTPTLAVNVEEIKANISWNKVPGAGGYTLYYAPAPYTGPDSIQSVDMGYQTGVSYNLWSGASFFVAVKAYNCAGRSGYSNIEQFVIP